jgi:hypothetical protein
MDLYWKSAVCFGASYGYNELAYIGRVLILDRRLREHLMGVFRSVLEHMLAVRA